jgi:hypothetical protein
MSWDRLRLWLRSSAPALYPLAPLPRAGSSGLASSGMAGLCCDVCRGPVRPGYAQCYQCEQHDSFGQGLLADAVAPISYAIKGTAFAEDLWRYKSGLGPVPPDPSIRRARASVLALLLTFVADHGGCVWRHAAMPPPDRLAVVPTGCGRPGPHPLLSLASPCLQLPVCPLAIRPGRQGRDLDPSRFLAHRVPPGTSVLLLEDSWVSGASAQSAAAALKLAGARHVAIVVLGRHVNPANPGAVTLLTRLAPARYDPLACAVHRTAPPVAPEAEASMVRTGLSGKISGPNFALFPPFAQLILFPSTRQQCCCLNHLPR